MPRKSQQSMNPACTDATCPVVRGDRRQAVPRPLESCECGQNATLVAVLASTLDPMVTIDSFGVIQSASDSIERVFGWKPNELVGRNVNVLMPQPHHSRHDGYLSAYRRTLKTNILGRTREFEGVRKDGTRFPIELSVARVDVAGQPLPLFVGAIRDISERKALEHERESQREHLDEMVKARTQELEQSHEQLRLADRLAVIGTLAAGLGHDMNNVLLPVRARLNALDEIELPTLAREHLASVRKSCAYLQQLTDGLHMLALNPDEGDPSDANTDLFEWWNTVGMLLSKAIPNRVQFEAGIDRHLPRVTIAAHRLTQAVLNLVVNAGEAIQSMPQRRRAGRVQLWAHATPDGRAVHLGVTDEGPGMSPDIKSRAFDAFFTTKKRGLGTGLGLSLVRSVVNSAGGAIDVHSEPGKGTEIVLTLPAAHDETASAAGREGPWHAAVTATDRRAASMAVHILEAAGWSVTRSDQSEPGDSTIWVTEPGAQAQTRATSFLRETSESGAGATPRAIVVLGEPPTRAALAKWQKLGALIAANPRDFDVLREAIGLAIRTVTIPQPRADAATQRKRSRPRKRKGGVSS